MDLETEAGPKRSGALTHMESWPLNRPVLPRGPHRQDPLSQQVFPRHFLYLPPSWTLGKPRGTRLTEATALQDPHCGVGKGSHIRAGSQKPFYMNVHSSMIYSS